MHKDYVNTYKRKIAQLLWCRKEHENLACSIFIMAIDISVSTHYHIDRERRTLVELTINCHVILI
jgi:hypothetical protein